MDAIRLLATLIGIAVVVAAYFWAMQVLMVRGAEPPLLARIVFRATRVAMYAIGLVVRGEKRRQQIWALYAPVSLLAVIAVSVAVILVGYTLIFYGVSTDDLRTSYINSVSSLSVLGFGGLPAPLLQATVALAEAFTGPIFVALLITSLASMYSALGQERSRLRAIEVQVGRARSGPDLLERVASGPGLAALTEVWMDWAAAFEQIEESYDTVEGYLMVFAPTMHNRWVADVEIVLDAANLRNSVIDLPADPQASRCLTAGATAIGHIVDQFPPRPVAGHMSPATRTASRSEFDEVCAGLAAVELPMIVDRDAAWQAFGANRKTYEASVDGLSALMHAPPSDWP